MTATPYDARIAEIRAMHPNRRLISHNGDLEEDLLRREGYLQAKADDAALLEAAREALLALRGHNLAAMVEPADRLEAAIAAIEGGTK